METVSGSSHFLIYVEPPVHSPYLLKSDGSALSLGPQFYIGNGWRCAQDLQLASLQWHLNPSPWLCPQISTGKCWCICNSSFACTQPTLSIHWSVLVPSFSQFLLHWLGFPGSIPRVEGTMRAGKDREARSSLYWDCPWTKPRRVSVCLKVHSIPCAGDGEPQSSDTLVQS